MRGTQMIRTSVLLALLLAVACDRGPGEGTLALAGDFRLGVEEVAEILAPAFEIPNDPGVVQAVADFWIDYTLLAWVLNRDNEFDRLDLTPLVRQETSQVLVGRLRDAVIQVDTTMTDEELRELFAESRPADQVRARHILLTLPTEATQAQRDSIQALAESLRDRARTGEDFALLAEEFSDDLGSAVMGGDLGYFGRGMMVPPFDSASFAMSPGDISEVVETDFGLHVIRLEDRVSPEMDELPYSYREQVQWELVSQAESIFLDQIMASANVQVQPPAADILREVAANPGARMSGSAASRAIAQFQGGSYTAADFRDFMMMQPADLRMQIEMATSEQLEGFARDLVRDRLLLAEAERRGIQMRSTEVQQIELTLRQDYIEIGELLGLGAVTTEGSSNLREAIHREVTDFLARVAQGTQDLIPMGELAVPLRNHYSGEVFEDAIPRVVARIDEMRVGTGTPDAFLPPPTAPGAPDALTPLEEPASPAPAPEEPAGQP